MSNKIAYFIAGLLLTSMITLAFFSMRNDSAIMDEVAHLPAGYAYIVKQDMRLNPEHPPLIKDLSGLSVWLWSKISKKPINWPKNLPAWEKDINGQWDFGFNLMYDSHNDADKMLFWGRMPMLLILLILGIYVFKWTKEAFGHKSALLALFLFSFSPTFLAHGRFVTTDVAAATGVFVASYWFVRWLKNPNLKNFTIAGFIFGLAQLAKFSLFLLVPLFFIVTLIWLVVFWLCLKLDRNRNGTLTEKITFWSYFWKYLCGVIGIIAFGYILVVWPVYLFHVLNYPVTRQQDDIKFVLSSFGIRPIADFIYWLAGIPVFRALAQYGYGLAMVLQRASGGNTVYFLGQVSAAGSKIYFPFVYLVKETLSLHLLTLIALILAILETIKNRLWRFGNLWRCFLKNVDIWVLLGFFALYWYSSLRSNLNIGVRHILPTFPIIFMIVSGVICRWLDKINRQKIKIFSTIILGFILAFGAFSVIKVYPSFLAYFNELIGGPANGYKYVCDSNLDWGQDLKRLAQWVEKNKIDKIYVDYFGGATSSYYLKEKFSSWWGTRSPKDLMPEGGYLAVSATFLQGGRGEPAPGFKEQTGYYRWLDQFSLVTVIGHSIFVFYIPPNSLQ